MSRYSQATFALVHAIDATLGRIIGQGLEVRAIYLPPDQYALIENLARSNAKGFEAKLLAGGSLRYRGERVRVGKHKRIYSQFGQCHDITTKPNRKLSRNY